MMPLARFVIAIALLLFGAIPPQKPARPDVPEAIAAPPNENVVLVAHASGSQIYVCKAGADQKLSWTLKGPDAKLSDASGKSIGRHFPSTSGPAWNYTDGSEVIGKKEASADAPDPADIPWLRLKATGHSGNGILSHVTTIQRIHTNGGQPTATGCDDALRGAEHNSPYSADYYFYAPSH